MRHVSYHSQPVEMQFFSLCHVVGKMLFRPSGVLAAVLRMATEKELQNKSSPVSISYYASMD